MEHYERFWRTALGGQDLPYGSFGENLTTKGLSENEVCVGDIFRIGGALVKVTIARKPCYKLNARFGRDDILPEYLESRCTGFYLTVVEEGHVRAGDAVQLVERNSSRVTIRNVIDMFLGDNTDRALLERTLALDIVTKKMRAALIERFEHFAAERSRLSDEETQEF